MTKISNRRFCLFTEGAEIIIATAMHIYNVSRLRYNFRPLIPVGLLLNSFLSWRLLSVTSVSRRWMHGLKRLQWGRGRLKVQRGMRSDSGQVSS